MIAVSVMATTGLGIAVTVGAYSLSLLARKHYRSPLTTPVLFSTAIVITILLATGISFADYKPAKDIITFLLGPATVALAIPLYISKEYRAFAVVLKLLTGTGTEASNRRAGSPLPLSPVPCTPGYQKGGRYGRKAEISRDLGAQDNAILKHFILPHLVIVMENTLK